VELRICPRRTADGVSLNCATPLYLHTVHPRLAVSRTHPPPVRSVLTMQLMEAMAAHLEALLAAPDSGPLSFAVVVPGWTEVPSWAALSSSSYLRRTLLVAKADHGYCDGAQHQRQDRFRDAPYDTAVFFLQNAEGARACLPRFQSGRLRFKWINN